MLNTVVAWVLNYGWSIHDHTEGSNLLTLTKATARIDANSDVALVVSGVPPNWWELTNSIPGHTMRKSRRVVDEFHGRITGNTGGIHSSLAMACMPMLASHTTHCYVERTADRGKRWAQRISLDMR